MRPRADKPNRQFPMNAYINTIGISRDDVPQVAHYFGNAAHRNHHLHEILGPTSFGHEPLKATEEEIVARGDQFNSMPRQRPHEVYACWVVYVKPPGTFVTTANLTRLGTVGGAHLAPDGSGMWAAHYNPHSGASDLNWLFSAFHYSPLLIPRRNRRVHGDAWFRRALNKEIQAINDTKAGTDVLIPLLRPPLTNRIERKVAEAATEKGLPIVETTLPILLKSVGAPYRILAGIIHFFSDGSHREIRFSVDLLSFIAEARRIVSRAAEHGTHHHRIHSKVTNCSAHENTLLNQWRKRATPPPTNRDTTPNL